MHLLWFCKSFLHFPSHHFDPKKIKISFRDFHLSIPTSQHLIVKRILILQNFNSIRIVTFNWFFRINFHNFITVFHFSKSGDYFVGVQKVFVNVTIELEWRDCTIYNMSPRGERPRQSACVFHIPSYDWIHWTHCICGCVYTALLYYSRYSLLIERLGISFHG